MNSETPIPEEFLLRSDTYSGIVPMHVDGDYYKDGVLLHSARTEAEPAGPEDEPGWTVQQ